MRSGHLTDIYGNNQFSDTKQANLVFGDYAGQGTKEHPYLWDYIFDKSYPVKSILLKHKSDQCWVQIPLQKGTQYTIGVRCPEDAQLYLYDTELRVVSRSTSDRAGIVDTMYVASFLTYTPQISCYYTVHIRGTSILDGMQLLCNPQPGHYKDLNVIPVQIDPQPYDPDNITYTYGIKTYKWVSFNCVWVQQETKEQKSKAVLQQGFFKSNLQNGCYTQLIQRRLRAADGKYNWQSSSIIQQEDTCQCAPVQPPNPDPQPQPDPMPDPQPQKPGYLQCKQSSKYIARLAKWRYSKATGWTMQSVQYSQDYKELIKGIEVYLPDTSQDFSAQYVKYVYKAADTKTSISYSFGQWCKTLRWVFGKATVAGDTSIYKYLPDFSDTVYILTRIGWVKRIQTPDFPTDYDAQFKAALQKYKKEDTYYGGAVVGQPYPNIYFPVYLYYAWTQKQWKPSKVLVSQQISYTPVDTTKVVLQDKAWSGCYQTLRKTAYYKVPVGTAYDPADYFTMGSIPSQYIGQDIQVIAKQYFRPYLVQLFSTQKWKAEDNTFVNKLVYTKSDHCNLFQGQYKLYALSQWLPYNCQLCTDLNESVCLQPLGYNPVVHEYNIDTMYDCQPCSDKPNVYKGEYIDCINNALALGGCLACCSNSLTVQCDGQYTMTAGGDDGPRVRLNNRDIYMTPCKDCNQGGITMQLTLKKGDVLSVQGYDTCGGDCRAGLGITRHMPSCNDPKYAPSYQLLWRYASLNMRTGAVSQSISLQIDRAHYQAPYVLSNEVGNFLYARQPARTKDGCVTSVFQWAYVPCTLNAYNQLARGIRFTDAKYRQVYKITQLKATYAYRKALLDSLPAYYEQAGLHLPWFSLTGQQCFKLNLYRYRLYQLDNNTWKLVQQGIKLFDTAQQQGLTGDFKFFGCYYTLKQMQLCTNKLDIPDTVQNAYRQAYIIEQQTIYDQENPPTWLDPSTFEQPATCGSQQSKCLVYCKRTVDYDNTICQWGQDTYQVIISDTPMAQTASIISDSSYTISMKNTRQAYNYNYQAVYQQLTLFKEYTKTSLSGLSWKQIQTKINLQAQQFCRMHTWKQFPAISGKCACYLQYAQRHWLYDNSPCAWVPQLYKLKKDQCQDFFYSDSKTTNINLYTLYKQVDAKGTTYQKCSYGITVNQAGKSTIQLSCQQVEAPVQGYRYVGDTNCPIQLYQTKLSAKSKCFPEQILLPVR